MESHAADENFRKRFSDIINTQQGKRSELFSLAEEARMSGALNAAADMYLYLNAKLELGMIAHDAFMCGEYELSVFIVGNLANPIDMAELARDLERVHQWHHAGNLWRMLGDDPLLFKFARRAFSSAVDRETRVRAGVDIQAFREALAMFIVSRQEDSEQWARLTYFTMCQQLQQNIARDILSYVATQFGAMLEDA